MRPYQDPQPHLSERRQFAPGTHERPRPVNGPRRGSSPRLDTAILAFVVKRNLRMRLTRPLVSPLFRGRPGPRLFGVAIADRCRRRASFPVCGPADPASCASSSRGPLAGRRGCERPSRRRCLGWVSLRPPDGSSSSTASPLRYGDVLTATSIPEVVRAPIGASAYTLFQSDLSPGRWGIVRPGGGPSLRPGPSFRAVHHLVTAVRGY